MNRETQLPEYNAKEYARHLAGTHFYSVRPISSGESVKTADKVRHVPKEWGFAAVGVLAIGAALASDNAVHAENLATPSSYNPDTQTLNFDTEWKKNPETKLPIDQVLEKLNSAGYGGIELAPESQQKLDLQKQLLAKTIAASAGFPVSDINKLGVQLYTSPEGVQRLFATLTPDLANPGQFSVLIPKNYLLASDNPYLGKSTGWVVVESKQDDPFELVKIQKGKAEGWTLGQSSSMVNNDGFVTPYIKYIDTSNGLLKQYQVKETQSATNFESIKQSLLESTRAKAAELVKNRTPLYYMSDGSGVGPEYGLGMVRDQDGVMLADMTVVVAGQKQETSVNGHKMYALPVVVAEQAPVIVLFPAGEQEVCGYIRVNENGTVAGSGGSMRRYCKDVNPQEGMTIMISSYRQYPEQFRKDVPANRQWMIDLMNNLNNTGLNVIRDRGGSGVVFAALLGGK